MIDFDYLEFRHLKFVQAIADAERFTSAANNLHISQPSLSTTIKQLEEHYDTQIFIRDRDGVAGLTAAGQVLLASAREMLQLREDTLSIMKALDAGAPTPLRVGFSSLVEKKLLQDIVELTESLIPGCKVSSDGDEIENLEARVKCGELDAALITLPLDDCADISSYLVHKERLLVCLRSDDPLAAHDAIPAHELNGRLGLFEYPQVHHRAHVLLLEMLATFGITPKQCHPTQNREHVQWMVQQGQCLALVRSGRPLLQGLTTRPIHGAKWTIDTAIIAKPSDHHPALAMLLREMRRRSWQFHNAFAPKKPPQPVRELPVAARKQKSSILGGGLPLFEAT